MTIEIKCYHKKKWEEWAKEHKDWMINENKSSMDGELLQKLFEQTVCEKCPTIYHHKCNIYSTQQI